MTDDTYKIYEIYKINENSGNVEVNEYGEWNPSEGLTIREKDIWKRRSNFKGHHLR